MIIYKDKANTIGKIKEFIKVNGNKIK